YIEGLGLAAAALFCYIQAIRRNNLVWACVGSLPYLLAAIAKELYVPLVVILAFLPLGNFWTRCRMVIPYGIAAGIYVVWRLYMLGIGQATSGYSGSLPNFIPTNLEHVVQFPMTYADVMNYSFVHAGIVCIGLILCLWFLYKQQNKTSVLLFFVLAAATFLPFFPVLSLLPIYPRYVFVFALVLYVAVFLGIIKFSFLEERKPLVLLIALSMLLSNVLSGEQYQAPVKELLKVYDARGRFLIQDSQINDVMIDAFTCDPYYEKLREHFQYAGRGNIVSSGYDICLQALEGNLDTTGKHYFGYFQGKMVAQRPEKFVAHCPTFNFEKPLQIQLSYSPTSRQFEWRLGPYTDSQGEYYILPGNYGTTRIMQNGALSAVAIGVQYLESLRILYKDPSGWVTSSPLLEPDLFTLDEDGIARFEWQRPDSN
ncbi:MAG: hypothetical protein AAF512_17045, partial [Pseudomonadota bacterium]